MMYTKILLKIAIISLVLLTIAILYILRFIIVNHMESESHIKLCEEVDKQLAFSFDSIYTDDGIRTYIINSVDRKGPMYNAGFRQKDLFIRFSSEDFYRFIVFNQDRDAKITIVRGRTYPERRKMEILLHIPKLKLTVDYEKINWISGFLNFQKGPPPPIQGLRLI